MTLTVVSNPVCSGEMTCQPSPSDGVYYSYDNVTLTAIPKHGFVFVNWTNDVGEIADTTQSTIIVPMDGYFSKDITLMELTANFTVPKGPYIVTVDSNPLWGGWATIWTSCGFVSIDNTQSTMSVQVCRWHRTESDSRGFRRLSFSRMEGRSV